MRSGCCKTTSHEVDFCQSGGFLVSLLLQEAAAATVASCCFCYSKGKPSWVEFEDPAEEEVEWVRLLLSQVAAEANLPALVGFDHGL